MATEQSEAPVMCIRRRVALVLRDSDELVEDERGETYASDVELRVRLLAHRGGVRAQVCYTVGCHVLLDHYEQELVQPLARAVDERTITLTPEETERALDLLREQESADG